MISCSRSGQSVAVPAVSFSTDILPIFNASCTIGSGCHIGSYNFNDHIDLTDSVAYNTIISKNLVNTGTPEASLLYAQVSVGIMPKYPYSRLPTAQISLILNWIKQGAKNN